MSSSPSSPQSFSGTYIARIKWFKDAFGYGFLTILRVGAIGETVPEAVLTALTASGDDFPPVRNVGDDIFVYHTDIVPSVSTYKTLVKGEYVQCKLSRGAKDVQAVDVRGIFGGPLLCDSINVRSLSRSTEGREPAVLQNGDISYRHGEDPVL